jgi:hypothetical protein
MLVLQAYYHLIGFYKIIHVRQLLNQFNILNVFCQVQFQFSGEIENVHVS